MDKSISTPNQTIYVNNLNEKIKLDELKAALFQLCSQYGEVAEIVASKAIRKRGQAFIVFTNINTAIKAKTELNDIKIFGKRINVSFAKMKSDYISNSLGLLDQETKLRLFTERKNRRELEYKAIKERILEQREKDAKNKFNINSQYPPGFNSNIMHSTEELERNSILFIEDLPKDIEEAKLKSVFDKYSGFREIRLHTGRGVCFVEYDNEINAESALIGLNQMNLNNECILNISFAKK